MSSAAQETASTVEREDVVRVLPPRPRMAAPPVAPDPLPQPVAVAQPPPPPPVPQSHNADRAFVGVLAAIAAILSQRLLLLLSVCFGFVLAVLAINRGGYIPLAALTAYCALTVLPLVWLDARRPPAGR